MTFTDPPQWSQTLSNYFRASLAELVDARDSKSRSFGSACSIQAWAELFQLQIDIYWLNFLKFLASFF